MVQSKAKNIFEEYKNLLKDEGINVKTENIQDFTKHLKMKILPFSKMDEEHRTQIILEIGKYASKPGMSDEIEYISAKLILLLMDSYKLNEQIQNNIQKLALKCMDSKTEKTVLIGIELNCNLLSSVPVLTKTVRGIIFDRLMLLTKKTNEQARAALYGLMLIAKDLTGKELKDHIAECKKWITKKNEPILSEYIAEMTIPLKAMDIVRKLPHFTLPKECQFISAMSRKGGTGKTTMLISSLIYLSEELSEELPKQKSSDKADICVIDFDCSGPSWQFMFETFSKKKESPMYFNDYLSLEDKPEKLYANRVKEKYYIKDRDTKVKSEAALNFDLFLINPMHAALSELNDNLDEMLLLKRLRRLYEWAARQYRYVIIDLPPGLYGNGLLHLYESYSHPGWIRFLVSSPTVADIMGITYEMDSLLLTYEKKLKPQGKDIWLLNQVPSSIFKAYADEKTLKGRSDLLSNVALNWPVSKTIPKLDSLLTKLAEAYTSRDIIKLFVIKHDIELREKGWVLGIDNEGNVVNIDHCKCLSALRNSDFYSCAEVVFKQHLGEGGDRQ